MPLTLCATVCLEVRLRSQVIQSLAHYLDRRMRPKGHVSARLSGHLPGTDTERGPEAPASIGRQRMAYAMGSITPEDLLQNDTSGADLLCKDPEGEHRTYLD
jgi:hypothetical protein